MKEALGVVGCGRWGSCLAWYLSERGFDVLLYGKKGSPTTESLLQSRANEYVTLQDEVRLTDSLSEVLSAPTLLLSVGAQNLRGFLEECTPRALSGKTLVLCMKGLESASSKRLSEVVRELCGDTVKVAIWVGPGHIQDFVSGVPNCMVIDSEDEAVKRRLATAFSSKLIRIYQGVDLVGNELCAAAKNVYGIGAGILDATGNGSLKGAFLVRSCVEMSRLITALGGKAQSVYGLSFLGETETTFFSEHSNNKRFGEKFIEGKTENKLCEGIYTLRALHTLSEKHGLDMPICKTLYRIVIEKDTANLGEMLDALMTRSLKQEF